jgi:hypothetical protein
VLSVKNAKTHVYCTWVTIMVGEVITLALTSPVIWNLSVRVSKSYSYITVIL